MAEELIQNLAYSLRCKMLAPDNAESVPPGHFYSAVPNWAQAEKDAHKVSVTTSLPGVDLNTGRQLQLLEAFSKYSAELPWKDGGSDEKLRYSFANDAYSYSDAIFYYSMLREMQPRKIIEVRSGNSTALALDVNELFFGNSIQVSLVEPFPLAVKKLLHKEDFSRLYLEAKNLQDVEREFFQQLEANDILFIDSTHVSKLGSDVNYLLHEILPLLSKGVVIHVHDIFYPFEYSDDFIKKRRAWNENYILHAFLQYNSAFEILFFNTYLEEKFPERVYAAFPLAAKNPGGSIWLRKIA